MNREDDYILDSEDLTVPQKVHRNYRNHKPWYWGVAGALGLVVLFGACNSMTRNQPAQQYTPAPQMVPQSNYDSYRPYNPTYIPVPVPQQPSVIVLPQQPNIVRERYVPKTTVTASPKGNSSNLGKAKVVAPAPSVRRNEYSTSTNKDSTWGGNRAKPTTMNSTSKPSSSLGNASGVTRRR